MVETPKPLFKLCHLQVDLVLINTSQNMRMEEVAILWRAQTYQEKSAI